MDEKWFASATVDICVVGDPVEAKGVAIEWSDALAMKRLLASEVGLESGSREAGMSGKQFALA